MNRSSSNNDITLFTLPYCPDCRDLRRHLTGHSVPFTEVDVVNKPGAVEEMLRINGGKRSAPTVRIGRQVLVDPDLKTLDAALLEAGLLSNP